MANAKLFLRQQQKILRVNTENCRAIFRKRNSYELKYAGVPMFVCLFLWLLLLICEPTTNKHMHTFNHACTHVICVKRGLV